MMYLHQLLPWFVLPIGITFILVLAGLRFRRRWLLWSGLAVLWLSSTPLISRFASRAIEGGAVRMRAADAPAADAVVVLSEGRMPATGPAAISEWNDGDRFFGGVELFKAGKAPWLVFTGGAAPWDSNSPLEGEVLAGFAQAMGVPDSQILRTARVTSTAEEAEAVAALLRSRLPAAAGPTPRHRVLLVTSAYHMSRARRLFERAGVAVNPFPVDFKASGSSTISVFDFFPAATALDRTETAMREGYGRLFYLLFK